MAKFPASIVLSNYGKTNPKLHSSRSTVSKVKRKYRYGGSGTK
jgi:hypothetical protein